MFRVIFLSSQSKNKMLQERMVKALLAVRFPDEKSGATPIGAKQATI